MTRDLPPRERQIVDLLYARQEATVAEVCAELPVALSAQAVRTMLSRLEAKGVVLRQSSDKGYVYAPAIPEAEAKRSALDRLVQTFFRGSPANAATALLGMSKRLDDGALDELESLIAAARKERQK